MLAGFRYGKVCHPANTVVYSTRRFVWGIEFLQGIASLAPV
jgi:hypothetical protein